MSDAIEQAAAKVPDIKSVLAAARRPETTATVCVAGDLAAEAERIEAELAAVPDSSSLGGGGRRAELVQELEDVIELMRGAQVTFRFRKMPRKDFSDLLAAHPPTDPNYLYNDVTFGPALIAASCISPAMTLQEAEQLLDDLSQGGMNALFTAAWNANRGEVRIPTSRAASVNPSSSGER